uniref:Cytochrome P450 n=1 Tax=Brachionus rotundiformis TaxID=96890 RepID=A0A5J6KBT7_9BILA|nr:cytochrome P450 [Brachionus rotundiformis]
MENLRHLNVEQILEKITQLEINPISVLKVSSITLASISLVYLGKIWYSYRFFKKRGLKSPEHEFFYGNFRQLIKNKNYSEILRDWTEKYGKTYGYFEGHLPVIVTSDLDIIQEVFIKQSTNFSARKKGYLSRKDNDPNSDLFQSTKGRWKRMRMIMNPTFSSAKLRELGPILVNCADRLIDVLNKDSEANKEVNVSEYFKRFTMDSIWNCAFGVDINMQYEKDNLYFKKCEEVFRISSNLILPQYLGIYFYEMKEFVLFVLTILMIVKANFANHEKLLPYFWLRNRIGELVKKRLDQENLKKKDYIQLLIDASADYNTEKSFDYSEIKKILSPKEVEANLVLFMLAGYETTSTALSYASHVLATHPDEQLRLHDEISAAFGTDLSLINSDSVQELKYLDWFVKEVLRYYPIGNSVVARRCTKKTTIKGIDIPVDTPIAVDVLSIHFDADLWGPHDPNQFYPPRHQVKRNPLAFMAFGNGPRNCIGMKFALIELKIALCKLIVNFEFLESLDKTHKLEYEEGVVRFPKNGIKVLLKKRV